MSCDPGSMSLEGGMGGGRVTVQVNHNSICRVPSLHTDRVRLEEVWRVESRDLGVEVSALSQLTAGPMLLLQQVAQGHGQESRGRP